MDNSANLVMLMTMWEISGSLPLGWMDGWHIYKIMPMVIVVYMLIYGFIMWYMDGEVGSLVFASIMLAFMMSMVMFLVGEMMSMVVSWEGIGLMSFLLIGFWQRSDALSSSFAAVMYNRLGDFFLMMLVMGVTGNWLLCFVAVLSKSAIWIMSYWLPMAMESPTPVSSLLHSSTMVVAGVTLSMWYMNFSFSIALSTVVIMSMFLSNWFDSKKMIAFSTSVHLSVMFLASTLGMTGLVLFHIITHGFVKASAFVSSGVVIGALGGQDLRTWGVSMEMMVMNLSFLLLCGIGSGMVFNSKEFILLECMGILIVLIGWNYSKAFFSNVSSYNMVMTIMGSSSILLFLMGGSGFQGVEMVSVMIFTALCMLVFNSMSGYVVNK